MATIDVTGLPEAVVQALEEAVRSLQKRYGAEELPKSLPKLLVKKSDVIGSLHRCDIYGDRA